MTCCQSDHLISSGDQVSIISDHRTLEDLRILRRDDGLRCVVGLDDMPSSDASGDWMRRMGANWRGCNV